MRLAATALPDKTPGEIVRVGFRLAPAIGTDVVSGTPTWRSEPTGLAFTLPGTTENGQTVETDVGGGTAGTVYAVVATCTLASGLVREPWANLYVKAAGA
jgi:hypothetical protein